MEKVNTERSFRNRIRSSDYKRFRQSAILAVVAGCLCAFSMAVRAATFTLPENGDTIVGRIRVVTGIGHKNTLLDIARRFDLGNHEITASNPGVSPWTIDPHQKVVAPTEFILPAKPWEGIVINVPQRRLFYFPKSANGRAPEVMTFPLSIFRSGWPTPLGRTRIIAKKKNPGWTVPKSIQEEHWNNGEKGFPSYFPPGPDNPMGMLAMETGFPEIFIHGTNRPWGVGMRTSHGCFHLYPEDAAEIFPILPVGTPVRIINEPYVAGLRDGRVFLAAFEPLSDYPIAASQLTYAVASVTKFLSDGQAAERRRAVDWDRVVSIVQTFSPVPVPVDPEGPTLQEIISEIEAEAYHFRPYGKDANRGKVPKTP